MSEESLDDWCWRRPLHHHKGSQYLKPITINGKFEGSVSSHPMSRHTFLSAAPGKSIPDDRSTWRPAGCSQWPLWRLKISKDCQISQEKRFFIPMDVPKIQISKLWYFPYWSALSIISFSVSLGTISSSFPDFISLKLFGNSETGRVKTKKDRPKKKICFKSLSVSLFIFITS